MSTPSSHALAPSPPLIAEAELLGTRLALADYDGVLDWVDAAVARRDRAYLCVAAVHTVMAAREDPALRAAVDGAAYTVPDGQPLVWALRALGHKQQIRARVYGPELMARACARAASSGQRHFLYGGRDERALARLAGALEARFPGLRIAGGHAPPFRELSDPELDALAAEIDAAQPDVVWVGIGVPKQEKWMATMRSRLEAPVLIGVGAAFDFHAGLIPQSPALLQRAGLEWAFRLAQEPRRLWRRYARYNPRFVAAFARQWASAASRNGNTAR